MWDKKLFGVVFIRRSSSIIGCLSSKVVFHQRPSSIKGCLPWKLSSLDGMPLLLCKICLFTKYEPHFRPQTLSKVWWGGWVDCGNLLWSKSLTWGLKFGSSSTIHIRVCQTLQNSKFGKWNQKEQFIFGQSFLHLQYEHAPS